MHRVGRGRRGAPHVPPQKPSKNSKVKTFEKWHFPLEFLSSLRPPPHFVEGGGDIKNPLWRLKGIFDQYRIQKIQKSKFWNIFRSAWDSPWNRAPSWSCPRRSSRARKPLSRSGYFPGFRSESGSSTSFRPSSEPSSPESKSCTETLSAKVLRISSNMNRCLIR